MIYEQVFWLTNDRVLGNGNFVEIRKTTASTCLEFYQKVNKKHIDKSVKKRSQTLLVPWEEICKRVLCNKHI